ncbi:MAG: LysE family transporter [Ignavibacteria bacterium]
MITALIIGIIAGFLLSMPPLGPTNFAIISKGLRSEVSDGIAIGAGAGIMDFVYIMIAYGGVSIVKVLLPESVDLFFARNEILIKTILTLLGSLVVFFYGVRIMRKKVIESNNGLMNGGMDKFLEKRVELQLEKTEKEFEKFLHSEVLEKRSTGIFGYIITGMMLCLSSVTLPASWIALVGYLKGYGLLDSNFLTGLAMALGVFGGTTLWFWLLVKLVSRNAHRVSPVTLGRLNVGVGIVLIVLGFFLLVKTLEFTLVNFI